jgi:glutaminyl-peptide cyclotransferase
MKKIISVITALVIASCGTTEEENELLSMGIVAGNDNVTVTIGNNTGETAKLLVNGKAVNNVNPKGGTIIGEPQLAPGMNQLMLAAGKDTLRDSVFFSYKIDFQLVKEYPHDISNFTEGLFLDNNVLYESTGLEGQSKIARYQLDPQGPTLMNEVKNDKSIFGEGIGISGNNLYQLTWQNHYVLVYDKTSLKPINKFVYPKEGWGLTPNGDSLIASDGSANLYFVNPGKFEIYNTLEVKGEGGPLKNINELELVRNIVVANVWQTNTLAFINKNTGIVLATADLKALAQSASQENPKADVLNGIAYDPADGTFLITGKLWSKLYRIKLDAVWDKLLKQQ